MTSIAGVITIVESPGYGLRGLYPSGNYIPEAPLGIITFDGTNGDPIPAPLVARTGTFEINSNKMKMTGAVPEGTIGSKVGAETGLTEGTISGTFNAEGGAGDEAGLMVRYIDAGNFIDCIFVESGPGTADLSLIEVTANAVANTHGTYAITSWDNTADYNLRITITGNAYTVYLDNVLVISATFSAHSSGTVWGAKYAGTVASFDNLLLPNATSPVITDSHYYVAGHSIFTHDGGPGQGPATDYTRTGTWLGLFATENGVDASGAGEFGHLDTINANWAGGAPASAALVYSSNTYPAWPSGTFAEQDFNQVLFMPSNFEQTTELPTGDYLTRAITFTDNVRAEEPDVKFFMYVGWPEPNLSGAVVDAANLTTGEFTTYKNYTRQQTSGGFLLWHTDWYDAIKAERANLNLCVIPVGPILVDIFDEAYMSAVDFNQLFVDDAPHGSESIYFLSAIISYRAMYGTNVDLSSYSIPVGPTILSEITSNLTAIIDLVDARYSYYSNNGVKVY